MGEVKQLHRDNACEDHGTYEDKGLPMPFGDKVIWFGCPECAADRKKESDDLKRAEDEYKSSLALTEFYRSAGIIKRYQGLKLDGFAPKDGQQKAFKSAELFAGDFERMCSQGQTLIFCGGVGTGKTRLVQAMLQTLGFGEYIRAVDISRRVRATYSDRDLTEEGAIQLLVDCPCLVIDEVGVQMGTEAEKNLISDIIDRRYGDMRPTVICSNLDESELAEVFGERAWDRLQQACFICPVTGDSQRKKGIEQ